MIPGDVGSVAYSINDKEQVVGQGSRAILWQNGVLMDLNTLVPGPPFSPLYLLQAWDINASGEIVGLGLGITGEMHAFFAVPCDEEHADAQGCRNDAAVNTAEEQPAPVTGNSGSLNPTSTNSTIRGRSSAMLDRLRARRLPDRYFPRPGSWTTRQP